MCVCVQERERVYTCGDVHVVLEHFQVLLHVLVFVSDIVQLRASIVQLRSELCSKTSHTYVTPDIIII